MATEKELYERALKKLGDPDAAAAAVAAYMEQRKPSAEAPSMPAPQRRMAATTPPKGGPVGTVTKKATIAATAPKPEVKSMTVEVEDDLPAAARYGFSPGAARMEDRALIADAVKYGRWAAEEADRKAAQDAASPFSRERVERDRASAARYYHPSITAADEQFNRDWSYGAGQIARLFREGENPRPKIGERAVKASSMPPAETYVDEPAPLVKPMERATMVEAAPTVKPGESDRDYLVSLGYEAKEVEALSDAGAAKAAAKLRATK